MYSIKIFKNGFLLILLLLLVFQNLHFLDYCEGMTEGLLYALTYIIFILTYLIIQLRDLYFYYKKKIKFDFFPILIFLISILTISFLSYANYNKYWKKIIYEGKIDDIGKKSCIILFEDYSFELTKFDIEQKCIYTGKYHFKNNLLILDDINIEHKTDGYFTQKYELLDTILKPLDKDFNLILLSK